MRTNKAIYCILQVSYAECTHAGHKLNLIMKKKEKKILSICMLVYVCSYVMKNFQITTLQPFNMPQAMRHGC